MFFLNKKIRSTMDNKNIDRCDLVYLPMFLGCLASCGVQTSEMCLSLLEGCMLSIMMEFFMRCIVKY
jgi:hypothetical protein